MADKYRTFTRSCRNWEEFARARKYEDRRNLTREEARDRCTAFNDNRTPAQIKRGTKMELTAQ